MLTAMIAGTFCLASFWGQYPVWKILWFDESGGI